MKKTDGKKPISKAKKIYNIISTVVVGLIFVFLVVLVVVMMVQRKNGGEITVFGHYMFDVVSDSMTPTIEKGDVIIAKKVENAGDLKVGDVITFVAPSGALKGYNETHRIHEIVLNDDGTIDYIKTAGDKLYDGVIKVDEWKLEPESVKAIYVRKSAFIGGLREFLSHWYGYVVLIALPMCLVGTLLIVGYVRDRVAQEKEKEKQNAQATLENMSDDDKQKLLEDYVASLKGDKQEGVEEVEQNKKTKASTNEADLVSSVDDEGDKN